MYDISLRHCGAVVVREAQVGMVIHECCLECVVLSVYESTWYHHHVFINGMNVKIIFFLSFQMMLPLPLTRSLLTQLPCQHQSLPASLPRR